MLILASQSPRRRELMAREGLEFSVVVRDTEEEHDASLPPEELCARNAAAKALAVAAEYPQATVVGADTLVFIDNTPLGKPADEAEAVAMLSALSGKTHTVYTGVAVIKDGVELSEAEETKVHFRPISDGEIRAYVKSGEPMDKAAAYGAQGRASVFVQGIEGDFFNVMGLPVCLLDSMLKKIGLSLI